MSNGSAGFDGDAEPAFTIVVEDAPDDRGRTVLVLAGELDSAASAQLGGELERRAANVSGLVLDMSEVSFIDSSGLRTLILARQLFPHDAGAVVLRSPQPATTRLLELTGLADYFACA